jgi:hypothetical protein
VHAPLRPFRLLSLALILAACSDQTAQLPLSPDVQAAWLPETAAFAQEIASARAAQAAFTDELMARPGVVGTAIGQGELGRPVVLVLVQHAGVDVPASLGGVGARRLVTGTIRAFQEADPRAKGGGRGVDRSARFARPVPIGVSTGHPAITAGTIGARVVDGSGNVFALSNNHVYADQNQATLGGAVIQPGTYDGGVSPADDIGTLFDFEWIDFSGGNNLFDAAIAATSTGLVGFTTGTDGYGAPRAQTIAATLNLGV